MRKFTLVLVLIALISNGFAQNSWAPLKPECQTSEVQHFTTAEWQDFMTTKAFGDTIWSEDFGGGAIPAGWTNVDNSGLSHEWIWYNDPSPGYGGQYSGNVDPFNSTTVNNGYMLLPGDGYNTPGTPSTFVNMDAYVIAGPINCDTASSVMLKFEQYFRYCCGTPVMNVSVSVDNLNWVDYDATFGLSGNTVSDNPDIVYINLTPIAAGEQTVYIRFYQTDVSHYYWAIDDIALITAPQNEIKFAKVYHSQYVDTWGLTGSFSRVPSNQIMAIWAQGNILNYGDMPQHNVTFETTIFDGSNTVVFNETADTVILSFADTAELEIASVYTPPVTPDVYTVAHECYQLEVDEVPENNLSDTTDFEITSNNIFSRDRHPQRWTGGIVAVENFTGGGDGDFLGVEYYLTNTDTVNSISVYIDYRTTVGTTILGQVYLDAATPTLVIESEEFLIEEEHIGTWVTLAMVTINPGDDILAGGSNYYCGVECYASGEDLNIGTEGEAYPHLLHLEAKLRLGTTWYWIHELPYVRLNLAGATLPAYFTSEPELECGLENYYSYTAEVTDPQNLTVTLEAESTNTDVLLDFIDNGNGTIDITTGATPFDAGLVLDDRFRIRVMVDNGTVVNEQYFWVTVVPTIGIADADINNINIYPNPAQNVLFVENAKNARIYIYNLLGDVVTSIERADMLNQISLDKFAAGTYIISVVKDNEVITKKFNKI